MNKYVTSHILEYEEQQTKIVMWIGTDDMMFVFVSYVRCVHFDFIFWDPRPGPGPPNMKYT